MSEGTLIGGGALGEVPYLRPHPGSSGLFARRAARFDALAGGHAAGDYLHFLAALAREQARAAAALRPTAPAPTGLPLDAAAPLGPGWHEVLGAVLEGLAASAMPPPAREACRLLGGAGAEAQSRLAAAVLAGRPGSADLAAAPLVGAALQVVFTVSAATLPVASVARAEEGCPVCGLSPVAGVVLGDDKLRYLVCGLCATTWHHTRAQCVLCRSSARLSLLSVEGDDGPARAECCDACRAYLKLLYVERSPHLEPFADDVASLALDLLVAERGYRRLGANLFLVAPAVDDA